MATDQPRFGFGLLWAGQATSQLGDYVSIFAIPYYVLTFSQNPLHFGLVHGAQDIPLIVFGLFSGVLLDRWSRRGWLLWANLVQALVFAALALVALDLLPGGLWVLVSLAFVVGAMTTAVQSALYAYVPRLVAPAGLARANARLSVSGQTAFIVGPILGGLLVEWAGFPTAFSFIAFSYLVSGATVLLLPVDHPGGGEHGGSLLADAIAGLRFIWRDHRLRLASLGASASNVVSAFMVAIIPLLATNELGSGEPVAMSVIYAAFGVGGVVGAATGGWAITRFGLGPVFVAGLVVWGLGFSTTTYLHSRTAILVLFALTGFGLPWVQISFSTLRQKVTPEPMLGRVMAGTRAVVNAAYPIGAVGLTALAAVTGILPISRIVPVLLVAVAVGLALGPLGRVGAEPVPLEATI